jgi:hypothetical protein
MAAADLVLERSGSTNLGFLGKDSKLAPATMP